MKFCLKILFTLFLFSLFIPILINAKIPNDKPVRGLTVEDVPFDDGGGLEISWLPFSKEKRIIEYRVYRGITPDTLFYIGKVDVNPKTGVHADTLRYIDQGWTFFIDVASPARLKREKGQRKETKGYDVLYQRVPKDMKIYKTLLDDYRILCVIPDKEYVYKTKIREFTDIDTLEDGTIDTTKTILAGLKLKQFRYIYLKHKVGRKYYYAVQAVNDNRTPSPISEIVTGTTTDDAPEKLREFYAVAYSDIEEMKFEWTLPLFPTDQAKFNIYLYDEDGDPHLIFTRPDAYPYTPQTNAVVPYDSIAAKFEAFNPANMKWYKFNIGEEDRQEQETLAKDEPIPAEITTSEILPPKPIYFTVQDNPGDKGDQNLLYYDYPYLGIYKMRYNNDFTRLIINYFIKDNLLFTVKNVTLHINENEHTEYVLDNKAKLKVTWDYKQPMTISATFKCANKDKKIHRDVTLPEYYAVSHTFYYNEQTDVVEFEKNPMQDYNFQVYKINKVSEVYRFPKLLSYMDRDYNDKIRYETVQFRGTPRCCLDDKRLYVSTYLSIGNYKDQKPYYTTALYLKQLEEQNKEIKAEIEKQKVELEKAESETEKEDIKYRIERYTELLEDKPPIVKKANKLKTDKARMKLLYTTHCENKRSFKYYIRKTDGKGHFVDTDVYTKKDGQQYFFPIPNWFKNKELVTLISCLIFGFLVYYMIRLARKGKRLYIRPIAGIEEIDNALGRATEMGRPILYVPGLSGIRDVATIASLAILGKVAKKAAEYDTRILVPCRDFIVLPIAQEIIKEAHYEAGRPDTYDKNSAFFVSTAQFAYVSGVNGIMIREKTATNFYMGMFWAESLLLTETGSMTGAIQIAGTDAVTQLPFFITTCDYTLMGEELYAASAYISKQPLILGTLKAQDYFKLLIIISVILGTLLATIHLPFFMDWFPAK